MRAKISGKNLCGCALRVQGLKVIHGKIMKM